MTNVDIENWSPDTSLVEQIVLHNIPKKFVLGCVTAFNETSSTQQTGSLSVRTRFIKFVLQKWRSFPIEVAPVPDCSTAPRNLLSLTQMTMNWRPSDDALEILEKSSRISLTFAEDAVPEFCIYWAERGEPSTTWNSKFVQHVKYQWLHYKAALETDSKPKPLPSNWQPNEELLEVLSIANIDVDFAMKKLPEFILYWTEAGRAYPSWNTKFLQHVKYHWSMRSRLSKREQFAGRSSRLFSATGQRPVRSTRDISLYEQLTDRSWADDFIIK